MVTGWFPFIVQDVELATALSGDADSMEAIVTGATPATLLGWISCRDVTRSQHECRGNMGQPFPKGRTPGRWMMTVYSIENHLKNGAPFSVHAIEQFYISSLDKGVKRRFWSEDMYHFQARIWIEMRPTVPPQLLTIIFSNGLKPPTSKLVGDLAWLSATVGFSWGQEMPFLQQNHLPNFELFSGVPCWYLKNSAFLNMNMLEHWGDCEPGVPVSCLPSGELT